MGDIKTVNNLTENELEELRQSYFDQLLESDEDVLGNIDSADGIPMTNVIAHYEGTFFVDEDFFCNL